MDDRPDSDQWIHLYPPYRRSSQPVITRSEPRLRGRDSELHRARSLSLGSEDSLSSFGDFATEGFYDKERSHNARNTTRPTAAANTVSKETAASESLDRFSTPVKLSSRKDKSAVFIDRSDLFDFVMPHMLFRGSSRLNLLSSRGEEEPTTFQTNPLRSQSLLSPHQVPTPSAAPPTMALLPFPLTDPDPESLRYDSSPDDALKGSPKIRYINPSRSRREQGADDFLELGGKTSGSLRGDFRNPKVIKMHRGKEPQK